MAKNIDITIAPQLESLKRRAIKGFRGSLKMKALWGLALALVFTSVALAAGYRCTPCKENYYCSKGISHECPTDRPVTFGTGAKSVDECFSCADRDGESYPFYDEISGDCMACWQVPETTTPYWNGTVCTACPDGKTWDSDELACVTPAPTCAFEIPHGDTTLCLVESVDYTAFESVSPQSAAEETTEFLSTYGIANAASSGYYPDYWAGAMKYCQDKGLRLPTMDELHSIMNVVYGTNNTCTEACYNSNSQYVGAQTGCCMFGDAIAASNIELLNFLGSNSTTTSVTSIFYLWSSAENSGSYAYTRDFGSADSYFDSNIRGDFGPRALCVK